MLALGAETLSNGVVAEVCAPENSNAGVVWRWIEEGSCIGDAELAALPAPDSLVRARVIDKGPLLRLLRAADTKLGRDNPGLALAAGGTSGLLVSASRLRVGLGFSSSDKRPGMLCIMGTVPDWSSCCACRLMRWRLPRTAGRSRRNPTVPCSAVTTRPDPNFREMLGRRLMLRVVIERARCHRPAGAGCATGSGGCTGSGLTSGCFGCGGSTHCCDGAGTMDISMVSSTCQENNQKGRYQGTHVHYQSIVSVWCMPASGTKASGVVGVRHAAHECHASKHTCTDLHP